MACLLVYLQTEQGEIEIKWNVLGEQTLEIEIMLKTEIINLLLLHIAVVVFVFTQ